MNHLKRIILIISLIIAGIQPTNISSTTIKGIKPFSIELENYYIVDIGKKAYDVSIGKSVKIIEFDGTSFNIAKTGLISKSGNIEKYGPILDKNGNRIIVSTQDKAFLDVMYDIMNTNYKYKFNGDTQTIFSFYSASIKKKSNTSIAFSKDGVNVRIRSNYNGVKTGTFISLLDSNFQFQSYETQSNSFVIKTKLAINPDSFNITMPFVESMVSTMKKFIYGKVDSYNNGFALFKRDSKSIFILGKECRKVEAPLIQVNNVMYLSVYELCRSMGIGIIHDSKMNNWKIIRVDNPSLYNINTIELIINDLDKGVVVVNGEKKNLKYSFIRNKNLSSPYLQVRELLSLLNIDFFYRDIDDSILIPRF